MSYKEHYNKIIAQAMLLRALSPYSYDKIVDSIKNKTKLDLTEKSIILKSMSSPFVSRATIAHQYKHVENIIKTKMALDKTVQQMLSEAAIGYSQNF